MTRDDAPSARVEPIDVDALDAGARGGEAGR
jgi:hypothetical protein